MNRQCIEISTEPNCFSRLLAFNRDNDAIPIADIRLDFYIFPFIEIRNILCRFFFFKG